VVDSFQISELAQELKLEADSAADEQALDQLADAEANAPETSEEVLPVSWDIDVVRWGEHDRVQSYLRFFKGVGRERFQVWLDRMPRYEPMIRARLQAASMPTDLTYLALIESGFSNSAVSRSRATGMWQFMRGTGKQYGLRIDSWVDERRDPVKATGAALRFLSDLYDRFGSYYLAAAAYNAGGGKISRGLRRIGPADDPDADEDEDEEGFSDADFFRLYDTRHIRRETKDYVPKLIAAALIAKEPVKYGFTKTRFQAQYPLDSVIVPGMTGLDVVARLADTTLAALRDLNPQYLRLVTPPGARSVVRLPAATMESVQSAYQVLPPTQRVSFAHHTTKPGDTPARIAERYGVAVSLLHEANPGMRSGTLRAGRQIIVPTGGEASVLVARQVATYREGVEGSGTVRHHRVRSGETLGGIARRYRVSVASLKSWNGLRGNIIRAGQRVRVYGGRGPVRAVASREHTKGGGTAAAPGTATVRHRVRRGETLGGIARRYGVTVTAIRQANDLSRGLRAGTTIRIPRRG
jgi:membrane-bound lytic murein transglycosylase D